MAKFLANENVPAEVVEAARQAGYDLAWVTESSAGADDDSVLSWAFTEGRVLVTFDKDFGKMAFSQGKDSTCGVILLRPRLSEPGICCAVHAGCPRTAG
jgi:predicted nuclease of predicted toxin-antitoxin system